jgi:hypothetical protein
MTSNSTLTSVEPHNPVDQRLCACDRQLKSVWAGAGKKSPIGDFFPGWGLGFQFSKCLATHDTGKSTVVVAVVVAAVAVAGVGQALQ